MYTLVGKMTMSKVALLIGFSWNCGFHTGNSQGLYDHTPNTKDSTKGNKKTLCSAVSQVQNQVQWHFTMSTVVMPPVNSITTTNQACPPFLNEWKTTINKTESNDRHGNTDSMPPNNKCQDMIPSLMPKHDNGHICQAFPICSLPLESSFNNITMASQQQISDGITPTNNCTLSQQIESPDKPNSKWQSTKWKNWI